MKRSAAIAIASSLVLTPAAAQALEPSLMVDGVPWPRAEQNRIFLEHDIWPTSYAFYNVDVDQIALAWAVIGQFRVAENVYIDAELPWAFWTLWNDSASLEGFTLGNLTAGAHYAAGITEDIAFWAGARIAVPTMLMDPPGASEEDDNFATMAAAGATASRSLADAHRFYPEHISMPVGGGIELRFADYFYYRGTVVPAFHFPVDGSFEFYIDQVNEIEARAPMGFGGGLRIQEVFTLSENDLVQLGMEPFIGYEPPGAGFIFRLGFMVALDESLGFGFDEGKVAAARIMLGGKF
ncbi:MAG: hypothetical protein JRI68_23455 [Deltaproteobacteria bacterium]|nr:hypothetical protein [Deltaproteobacteria bacterium]